MLHHRIGQTEVAFGILEVDRVHFMRHGGRADFAGNGLLFEMVERDIAPHVTIEINQDGVEAGDAVKQFGDIVVRFNLGGVRVPLDTQRGDELFAELVPVNFRVGGDVGVIVPHRAVDFAKNFNLIQLTILALHTVSDVRHLFTHGGRRGRLAVGAGKQRDIAILYRQVLNRVDQLAPVWQDHFVAGGFQHQRVGQIVDVLGGAGEVDKLGDRVQFCHVGDFFLEEILNRFDVVVGGALDRFDALCIFYAEIGDDFIKVTVCVGSKSRNFLDRCVRGQFLQPTHFYLNAEFQQTEFAEDTAQRADFIAVAAVYRGNGGQ